MSDVVIHSENLGKQYRIGAKEGPYRTLRDSLTNAAAAPFRMFRSGSRKKSSGQDKIWELQDVSFEVKKGEIFKHVNVETTIWALKNVSFEVNQGEILGIIGANGAGKSTLLKILSRITEPTEGRARLKGRVGTLLEVGTGFHPELTGRENIYLNAAILGMKKAEIDRKFDEIVAFAEVEKFIDTPVKHYSSGMHLRLGFAVAAHLDPEILVVDEVLAVGDAHFQNKCLGKMGDVAKQGRTVLFVSHNMPAIQVLCPKAILLTGGKIADYGAATDVCRGYLRSAEEKVHTDLGSRKDRRGSQVVVFKAFRMLDRDRHPVNAFLCGQTAILRFEFENRVGHPLHNFSFALGIDSDLGYRITHLSTDVSGPDLEIAGDSRAIEVIIDKLPLAPGRYTFTIFSTERAGIADWVQEAGSFFVEAGDYFGTGRFPAPQGVFIMNHRIVVSDS